MPSRGVSKTLERSGKKSADYHHDQEIKKMHSVSKESEHGQRNKMEGEIPQHAEAPSKSSRKTTGIPKARKTDDLDKGKRVGSAILDKIPKKSAQRAKGSIALGKALDKMETETMSRRRPPSASMDRISRPSTREGDAPDRPLAITLKPKTPERPVRVRSLRKVKDIKPLDSKDDVKKKKKPWVSVLDKGSRESLKDQMMDVVEHSVTEQTYPKQQMMPVQTRIDDSSLESPPSPSCSFFEKIQQGVKAYFISRNSLRGDSLEDKNKKKVTEGGTQNGAGVGKGVKEDYRKRKRNNFYSTGINFKSKINYTECDLFDRPRLNLKSSKSGGQLSNFSSSRPKNLRNYQLLKRKRLYHPKKQYVRIQIPRKGYFYRSTFYFKDPGPPPPSFRQRLELGIESENESEIQITRVAATSAKGSNIFKKRISKSLQKKTYEGVSFTGRKEGSGEETVDLQHLLKYLQSESDKFPSLASEYLRNFTASMDYQIQNSNEPNNRVSSNLLDDDTIFGGKSLTFLVSENIISRCTNADEFVIEDKKGGRRAVSDNPINQNILETKNQTKIKSHHTSSGFGTRIKPERVICNDESLLDVVQASSEKIISCETYDSEIGIKRKANLSPKTRIQSDASFETLVKCLNSVFEAENLTSDLEISSASNVTDPKEVEFSEFNDFKLMVEPYPRQTAVLQCIAEEPIQRITEILGTVNEYESNLQEEKTCELPSVTLSLGDSNDSRRPPLMSSSEDNLAASLMNDIDIHLELQNYMKAIDSTLTRARTKNTIQQSLFNYSDSEEVEEGKFEIPEVSDRLPKVDSDGLFFDVAESKSSFSFISALSTCGFPKDEGDSSNLHVFLEHKYATSISDELLDTRSAKNFTSQTRLHVVDSLLKKEEVRRIKSENDPKKLQVNKSKSSIKRTFGKTSFQVPKMEESEPTFTNIWLQRRLLASLFSTQPTAAEFDTYEKIAPLKINLCQTAKEKKPKSNILYRNLVYSLSAESLTHRTPTAISDHNQTHTSVTKSSGYLKEGKKQLSDPDQTSSSQLFLKSKSPESRNKWSPNLQELIDIYSAFLRKNQIIRRSSKNSLKRYVSVLLFSFLDCKLKERKEKSDLIKYLKSANRNNFRVSQNSLTEKWKGASKKKDTSQIEEYVNMFQEILLSSLSINQITRLNNIMADYHEKNRNTENKLKIKSKKEETKKPKKEAAALTKPQPAKTAVKKSVPPPKSQTKPVQPTNSDVKSTKSTIVPPLTPKEENAAAPRATKKLVQNKSANVINKKVAPKVIIKKKENPSSPKQLETILKKCFKPGTIQYDPTLWNLKDVPDLKNKFLVTVKLCGNKILVSGLSRFKNDKIFTNIEQDPQPRKGTSELIFENITKNQTKKGSTETKKPGKPTQKQTKKKAVQKAQNSEKVSKKLTPQTKKLQDKKIRKADRANNKKINSGKGKLKKAKNIRKKSEKTHQIKAIKSTGEFEYNQLKLKTHQPLEAIIEKSESKTDENVENDLEIPLKPLELCSPKRIKLNRNDNNLEYLKRISKEMMEEKLLAKTLSACDSTLFRINEKIKLLDTTRSSVFTGKQKKTNLEKYSSRQIENPSRMTKFRDDSSLIKSRSYWKLTKIVPLRTRSNYLCYSSYQNLCISKTVTNNKKPIDGKTNQRDRKSKWTGPAGCHKDTSRSKQSQLPVEKHLQKRKTESLRKWEPEITRNIEPPKPQIAEKSLSPNPNKRIAENKLSANTSTNTILFLNNEVGPDCYSLEFIFNDENKPFNSSPKSSSEMQPKSSSSDIKKHEKSSTIPKLTDSEETRNTLKPNICKDSLGGVGSHNESSIIIHSAKGGIVDNSFPSLMIRSDTCLTSRSTFALSKSKVKSFFKSNSDMKFYPGRISDSEEQNPLVTFVLTPRQKAVANVPSGQVKVVERLDAEVNEEVDEIEKTSVIPEPEDKTPLQSIEDFLDFLSKRRRDACQAKKKQNKTINNSNNMKKETPKYSKRLTTPILTQNKKCFIPCQRLQMLFASDRKMYHECQRRAAEIKAKNKAELERNIAKLKSKDANLEKEIQNEIEENKFEFEKENNIETGIETENNKTESEKKLSEELKDNGLAKTDAPEIVPKDQSLPPEWLNLAKNAITNASGLTKKHDITAALDEYSGRTASEKEPNKIETTLEPDTADIPFKDYKINEILQKSKLQFSDKYSNAAKKVKTFKIKIHCNNRRVDYRSNKFTRAVQKCEPIQESENEPHNPSFHVKEKEIDLLESFVSKNTQDSIPLEKKLSDYYEATEDLSKEETSYLSCVGENLPPEENSEGTRDFMEPTDTTSQTTVESLETSRPVILTQSDQNLFARNNMSPELEDQVFQKIIDNLKSNNICYSMTLLESYIRKIKDFDDEKINRSTKLKEVLHSIDIKSRNLMINLEKNGWLKILSLLESISAEFKKVGLDFNSQIKDKKMYEFLTFIKKKLKATRRLMAKIQNLNDKKISLQSLSSQSQKVNVGDNLIGDGKNCGSFYFMTKYRKNVLCKIRNSLFDLKNKFNKWSQPFTKKSLDELNFAAEYDSEDEDFGVHSAKKTILIPFEKISVPTYSFDKNRLLLQYLKKQVRHQRLCIQYLVDSDFGPVTPEIQGIRNKVIEELSLLEEIVSGLASLGLKISDENLEKSLMTRECANTEISGLVEQNKTMACDSDKSFINLAYLYRGFLSNSATETNVRDNKKIASLEEKKLHIPPNCMRSLIEIWNTKNSMASLSADLAI